MRPVRANLPIALGLLLLCTTSARAGFIAGVSGAVNLLSSPPADASALKSDSYSVWSESSATLTSALKVDQAGQPGDYDGLSNLTTLGATLAQGTPYVATMIQLNPATQFPLQSPIGSVTFTGKIIGLALFGTSLDASDIYGNPTTVYPHGLPTLVLQTRGIDFLHNDRYSISADGKTLSLQLTAGMGQIDQIRVITAPTSVPEPASLCVWLAIGGVLGTASRWLRRLGWYSTCL